MEIYKFISKLIPENRFKQKIKNLFYKLLYSIPLGYSEITIEEGKKIKLYKFLFCPEKISSNTIKAYVSHYKPKKKDIVIDAGASPGDFTIYASKLVGGKGKVICFEPDINGFKLLLNNIELNKLKNVIAINKGLWSKERTLNFGSQKINVVTLDSELKKLGVDRVDFIKMDIEGAEIESIKGCKDTLKKNMPNLAIASYHVVNGKKTSIDLEKMLNRINYKTITEYPPHPTTFAFPNTASN